MYAGAEGWTEARAKAEAFVSKLTLAEKVNLTTGSGWMADNCLGNTGSVPRLGLRALCLQDGPVGLRFSDYNSAFPSGQTVGATWSRKIWAARGRALGAEAKGKGIDVILAPSSGPLGRVPAGGRNNEGFGSDPYLQGQAAAEMVQGIQSEGVIACAKHWIANEQEHFREFISSNVDDKTMHELYAWPFADAVRAGVGSIMCSYNQINNSYACQNSKMMNGILKGEMGFQGFVVSDWMAQHSGVASALAGLDMTMAGDIDWSSFGRSYWGSNLTMAVLNGTVPEWRIDDMAMRIMSAFFKVGNEVESLPKTNFNSWSRHVSGFGNQAIGENYGVINGLVDVRKGKEHANHIRDSAAKGTVILKNNGILPLRAPRFLAVVGEDARTNPQGPNSCRDRACNNGTLAMTWGSGTANFPYLIDPHSALQRQAIDDGTRYESVLTNKDWASIETVISQPHAIAIVFVNAASGEGYLKVEGNAGDRSNLNLWNNGDELIKNVSSVNPRTIVVIHSVGPVLMEWHTNPNISAILWAGLPGQESGNSIVDILYGKKSPGRSPFSWGPSRESYGTDIIYEDQGEWPPQQDFKEGLFVDYRHFDKVAPEGSPEAPMYEFGFGLSWSEFEYSDLVIERHSAPDFVPTTGFAPPAPVLSDKESSMAFAYPPTIRRVRRWIYPWLDTDEHGAPIPDDPEYGISPNTSFPAGATDGGPQPLLPSSGGQGGHPQLWDVMYTVRCTIKNVGSRTTDEIPQLYVSLGGPDEPVRVLRGFDRLEDIGPGMSVEFRAELTRRDVSNWDPVAQNWVVTKHPKRVWVGSSSRDLRLSASLDEGELRD
ncbi:hypothetical protein HIM_07220 [Hirsutella minnesotensis 3608]|uniref:beta-glucosidase n=1 Tax=Hirsutella minnesotensis 3608 TaxID=1043627 RepID=A0A0F7ZI50_9HYPO|nr:hypothetical protein HIM_07220 [Hirsutella minnesotensis 3608]